jgi:hypothetical protein
MRFTLERALFVVGIPNSGKSSSLRSMFLDHRLGTDGVVPTSPRLPDSYYLSNDRRLHIRLTSPHEAEESPKEYMDKAAAKMYSGRWNFACPLQPLARNKMPDVVKSVELFISYFEPERVRVVFLSPTQHNEKIQDHTIGRDLSDELLAMDQVEVMSIDARRKHRNGLLLTDFFDFT